MLQILCRAEATDVANAVLDGADGLLLGAETLRGKYPAITVKTVLAICCQAEEVFDYSGHFEWLTWQGEKVNKSAHCSVLSSPRLYSTFCFSCISKIGVWFCDSCITAVNTICCKDSAHKCLLPLSCTCLLADRGILYTYNSQRSIVSAYCLS